MCNKDVGSLCGGCAWCKIEGVRVHNKTAYLGAIRHTSKTSVLGKRLRREFAEEFKELPEVADLASLNPPAKMTVHEAVQSGRRVKRARETCTKAEYERIKKKESFTDVDAFTSKFGVEWNKQLRNAVDLAHEVKNLVKGIVELIANIPNSGMSWTKERARREREEYGRFTSRDRPVRMLYVMSKFPTFCGNFACFITLLLSCNLLKISLFHQKFRCFV